MTDTIDPKLTKKELLRVCEEFKSERDAAIDSRNFAIRQLNIALTDNNLLSDMLNAKLTVRGIGESIAVLIRGWFR